MWTLPKTLSSVNTPIKRLKLANFGTVPSSSVFSKLRYVLSGSNEVSQIPEGPLPAQEQELVIIEDNETEIIPFRTALLYQLEGAWTSLDSELNQVFSLSQLDFNTYIWIDGFTYVISDETLRNYKGKVQKIVVDEVNFGFFENSSDIVKVVSNGLPVDFTINDLNELIILPSSNPSCKPRFGDIAEITFETQFPNSTASTKHLIFFQKPEQIDLVTYFIYEGQSYYTSSNLELATSLINSANNTFFVIN